MDVGGWLRGLGLGEYEEKFRDNKIDADVLPRLTVDDLKDIGVSVVGDRRRLLDAIAVIAGAGPPADVPASPTKTVPSKGLQASAERRPITVMFCDLAGSTGLAARLDAEDWRNLVNSYLDETSAAVTGLGGHVLKKLGDGLMALFGYPHVQENDAERAVRAALAIQRALSDLNARNAANGAPELSARVGIESGPVVVEASGEVFGDAPNVAARVQAAAEPGSVLITLNVQRQVAGLFVAEELGARELKGVSEPVQLFRIVRASGGGRRGGARALTPFVGREEELGMLARRWERAKGGEGQLVLIVGEPGLGKSRLIEEFHGRLAETPHTWVEWSASQLLQNTPLHPIAEWGRQRFGLDDPAEQRLADLENTLRLIGLDPAEHAPLLAPLVDIPLPPERATSFPPEELRRRQLAAMTALVLAGARSQPVVLAFEDLHWADPTSLDLLRALADRGAQAPLLLLATTRPEFRPPWSLRSHHSLISLSPLDRAGVARMVGEISASHALSKELIEGVSERTGGVPLFVEEVTRLLLERGVEGGAQVIPPTLQQSLAARLDRLGEAREVAQIGAVLGRDFSYRLLRELSSSAAGFDELRLQAALDRLVEADLVFVEGAAPAAAYRFKHALIQDAAYDSLLKSRRQALHRRAGEILRDQPERATAEPEAVAHHFTQAGLDDIAIEWWGKAGDQALRRSAFQEAIAHLGKAIEMADKVSGAAAPTPHAAASTASASQRLKLQTSYGQAVMWSKGYAAEETKAAFARVGELATETGNAEAPLDAYFGRWVQSLWRGEFGSAREAAESFQCEAEREGRLTEAGVARRMLGLTLLYQGDFGQARAHLEQALRIYDPVRDLEAKFRLGSDSRVLATSYLAFAAWCIGDVARARELIDEARARAVESTHAPALANTYLFVAMLEIHHNDAEAARRAAETSVAISREHGLALYLAGGALPFAWARAKLGDWDAGSAEFRQALADYASQGNKLWLPFYRGLLAEIETQQGGAEAALAGIDEALALAGETGEHWFDAALHRIRGEILLKQNPADPAPAEAAFLAAIAVAQQQKARSFELRAALSLAKLYQSTGRPAEAHAALGPALEGFLPTTEFPDIAAGQALLEALAETDDVKAAITTRHKRVDLQIALGNALIAARGYGAAETQASFERARALTFGTGQEFERFSIAYGLYAVFDQRGDVARMREHASEFLSGVSGQPDSPEAGVAHRISGIYSWYVGDLIDARTHLEKALAISDPERDRDLAFRFGHDPRISASVQLGVVLWLLGEVVRAAQLFQDVRVSIPNVSHLGTTAQGNLHAAMFEVMRRNHVRAAEDIRALASVAHEHDLALWKTLAFFLEGWSTWRASDRNAGLVQMRAGVAQLAEREISLFGGLIRAELAQAEAQSGEVDKGLITLESALKYCERIGQRWFDAEIHRIRGEILLKKHADSPALAEDAYRSAIAIAQRQKARSFELRAALALAKLYQSTARPADAHAVLAPAFEGFAPTDEMPEIAEAQKLLVAIEVGAHEAR